MDSSTKICIIHRKDSSVVDEILPVTDKVWNRIKVVSEAHKTSSNYETSVWKEVIEKLPLERPENSGYHSKCFQLLTALPKSKLYYNSDPIPCGSSQAKSATTLRSKSNKISKSDTGVLEKICIFCKKSRKTFKFKLEPLRMVTLDKCEQSIKYMIQRSDHGSRII